MKSHAFSLLALAMVASNARATFRGVYPCGDGRQVSGDTRQYSNENYNPSSDAYYNIRLGRGRYSFSSCGSYYDTWLRIFPGTYQQNNGYASCADRNSYQGTNCASCDDCGGCGTRTILGIQITEAGWYTLLVEGWSNSRGSYGIQMSVQSGSCTAGFSSAPTTSAPTTSAPTTLAPTTKNPTSAPTASPTASPTTSAPTASPTASPTAIPTAIPTRAPTTSEPTTSIPTESPTTDRCRGFLCSKDCDGGCGWSRRENTCLTINGWNVFASSLATRDALLEAIPNACARYTTTTTTEASDGGGGGGGGNAAGSTDDDANANSTTLMIIIIAGVCILIVICLGLFLLSRAGNSQPDHRSDAAFNNPQYAGAGFGHSNLNGRGGSVNSQMGGGGGYIDVDQDEE